jgi:hypothetical protein
VAFGEGYRPIPVGRLDLHAFEHKPLVETAVEPLTAPGTASTEAVPG